MDDVDSEAYLDESEEPLFADDLDDDDDIPAPPSPINEEEIRRRVRLQGASNSSRAGDNSLAFGTTSVPWPDEQGGETSTAAANPDVTEQPVPIKKRKPVLTLGPDRLTGERGFKVLKNEFPLIKFRGKGHEASDLKLLMSRYEHWAHRLFPKMTFQDVLERIEKLAVHKEVKNCLSQMRGGREFQTTIDSSEEDDEGEESESLHNGERQQASNTAVNDADEVHVHLNDGTDAELGAMPTTHSPPGRDHNTLAQPAVIQVSPACDADSDDEWNMLGRRVTDKEQHLPNQDGPARVHTMQITVNSGVTPDADSDSDDEWNMLGRRVVSSKDQHLPHEEGLTKVCETEGSIALALQSDKTEKQDKSHLNDDQCSDNVTQPVDTNAEGRVQTFSHTYPLLANRDTSNSTDTEVQVMEEQAAMDTICPQDHVTADGSSSGAGQLVIVTEVSNGADPARQLLAATEDSGETLKEVNSGLDTELPLSQNEVDDFFAKY